MSLVERLRPGTVVVSNADVRRLAYADDTIAKLQHRIKALREERDEAVALAASRLERLRDEIESRVAAEQRALDLRVELDRCRSGHPVAEVPRPEMCRSLDECTANRAAAERVSRVIAVDAAEGGG